MSRENILLCGLPDSGKTTFIAALWYQLFQKEIPTSLSLVTLPSNREYLNKLSGKWSRVTPIDRTATEEIQEISLHLKDNETSNELELHVPDMSGETWENIWSNRSCAVHTAEWSQDASGVMLFIHSDKIRQPIDIEINNDAQASEQTDSKEVSWAPNRAPTQVMLVDILQALSSQQLQKNRRRLAVIISAWDKAEVTGLTPEEYVSTYLPLLNQFLNNSGMFSQVMIYGVSALGGDLESEVEIEKLKSEDIPSNRIKVVEGSESHHDLTGPIKWLMS
ncbi:MAG: hypothetical protein QM484_07145 [Woeseiaceae bacterium]